MSCVSDNCPCKKRNNPCKRKCRCYNCKNVNNGNNSKDTGVKKPLFNKGCGCGLSKKSRGEHPIQESCRDGSRKSKCPCVAEGIGCTELCRCLNCANIVQPRVAPVTPIKQKKRKRELLSPYKRKGGKEFMESRNVSITSGTWKSQETYCLIVCREVLLSHDISVEPSNLKLLYNFVAQSNIVNAMSLTITIKSQAQITAKIAHLREYHKVNF